MAEATKSPSKAATYSVRREVGVMAAFIAIFIISLVAFGVASRSEFCITEYSFQRFCSCANPPQHCRPLRSWAKKREEWERRAVLCLEDRGYISVFFLGRVREGFVYGSAWFPFVEPSLSNLSLEINHMPLHAITDNSSWSPSNFTFHSNLFFTSLQVLSHICTKTNIFG